MNEKQETNVKQVEMETIQEKMNYCLNCTAKPCSKNGCPLSNDIPTFIKLAKEGNLEEAYKVLSETTVLGSICGRICPHQKQCEGSCVRGIKGKPVNIGEIESYIFDNALEKGYYKEGIESDEHSKKSEHAEKNENTQNAVNSEIKTLKGKKIAVVGGGPAGITCSSFLAKKGAEVTIYEKYNKLGGILSHGIPDFRLDKNILEKTINAIIEQGIKVEYNKELGKDLSLKELQKKYDAVFLAFGANIPRKMAIEGEDLDGVYGGNTLLELNCHPDYKNKSVAIIGGGNVAMDCARTIKRLGAKRVVVIYRRSEAEMPAEVKEIADAKKEGIEFLFQNNITKILGNGKVEKIECIKTELVQKEGENRKVPVDIEGSNYIMDMDYVVMAVGAKVELEILENEGLPSTKKKYLEVNENYQIEGTNIFAGGDLVGTTSTVAWAARDGREASKKIEKFIKGM